MKRITDKERHKTHSVGRWVGGLGRTDCGILVDWLYCDHLMPSCRKCRASRRRGK